MGVALQQLYYVDFAYNTIDGEGARLLAECHCTKLRILDMSGNDISSNCVSLCTSVSLVGLHFRL